MKQFENTMKYARRLFEKEKKYTLVESSRCVMKNIGKTHLSPNTKDEWFSRATM